MPSSESVPHPLGVPFGLLLDTSVSPPVIARSDLICTRVSNPVKLLRALDKFLSAPSPLLPIFTSIIQSSLPSQPIDVLEHIEAAQVPINVNDLITARA